MATAAAGATCAVVVRAIAGPYTDKGVWRFMLADGDDADVALPRDKNARAKELLGFEPYWTLDRGLAHTAEWYRENGWL